MRLYGGLYKINVLVYSKLNLVDYFTKLIRRSLQPSDRFVSKVLSRHLLLILSGKIAPRLH